MEIKKGLTLGQFVDKYASHNNNDPEDYYNNTEMLKEADDEGYIVAAFILDKIVQYRELLKQPLLKEMFINEVEKPNESLRTNGGFTDQELYNKQNKRFKEAERKVIFKGWEYFDSQADCLNRVGVEFKKSIFPYGGRLGVMIPKNKTLHTHFQIETLHDLFQVTNGTLELQNITI